MTSRRQGKFQLEVLPDVGHYLHEVRGFLPAKLSHFVLILALVDPGQARKIGWSPRCVLEKEYECIGLTAQGRQCRLRAETQNGRGSMKTVRILRNGASLYSIFLTWIETLVLDNRSVHVQQNVVPG
jgi:coenzyme F420-reducing hydrogenase gamma subunit